MAKTAVAARRVGSRGRVFVPKDAVGLLAAIAAARDGRVAAFHRWEVEVRPLVRRALRRAGFDPASAEEAILYLIEEAEAAVRTGQIVACEPVWMSAVLTHFRTRRHRRALREELVHQCVAAALPAWIKPRQDDELREELLAAAARLDPRLKIAIRLRLRDLDHREVRLALCVEFGVGPEQARKIEGRALAMMRAALAARHM